MPVKRSAATFAALSLCLVACGISPTPKTPDSAENGSNKKPKGNGQITGSINPASRGADNSKTVVSQDEIAKARETVQEFVRLLREASLLDHDTPQSTLAQNLDGTISASYSKRLGVTIREVHSTLEGAEQFTKYYPPLHPVLGSPGVTAVYSVNGGELDHKPLGQVRRVGETLIVPTCVIAPHLVGRVLHRRLLGQHPPLEKFKTLPRNSRYVRFVVIKDSRGKYVVDAVQQPEKWHIPCIGTALRDRSEDSVQRQMRAKVALEFINLAADDSRKPRSLTEAKLTEVADGPALRYLQEHTLITELYRANLTNVDRASRVSVSGVDVLFDNPAELTAWGTKMPEQQITSTNSITSADVLDDFGPGLRSLGVCVRTEVKIAKSTEKRKSAVLMIFAYNGNNWRVAAATTPGMLRDRPLGELPSATSDFINTCERD